MQLVFFFKINDQHVLFCDLLDVGTNPCDGAQCSSVQQCAIDRYGIAKCECGPECEPVMRPVCARGGTTYNSLCELKRQACMTKTSIELAYTGNCGSRGPCSEKVCLLFVIIIFFSGTCLHCMNFYGIEACNGAPWYHWQRSRFFKYLLFWENHKKCNTVQYDVIVYCIIYQIILYYMDVSLGRQYIVFEMPQRSIILL